MHKFSDFLRSLEKSCRISPKSPAALQLFASYLPRPRINRPFKTFQKINRSGRLLDNA